MLSDGANTYTYNAESEITTATGVTYTYDGDGNRVEKSGVRIYWYGAGSEILDETDLSGNFQLEMVYFGGKRVAHRTSSNVIYYYEGDLLGSARTIVQAGQTSVCYDADFSPFGGERVITDTCSQSYKFEGKKRDNETGNDDFGARYYRWNIGRWLSADWSAVPAPVPYANLTNPQTLNLYAMVSDNPETFADLDGHVSEGGGPYNLETGDVSEGPAGNCDYMGGDCSQKETEADENQQQQNQAQQQNTVTVDYDKGQSGNPAGHASISVNGQQAVGLEQKKDSVAAALGDKTTQGTVTAVDPNRIKDKATISVTPAQAAKIQAFLNHAKQNPPNYNLYHSNCAQFCEAALKAGGVKYVPNDITPRGLVHDLNGTSLLDYIRMIPLPPIP